MRRARILLLGLGALLAPAAVALAAQTVETGAAKEIQPSSAILTGTVNPGGAPTQAAFQFGTTTAYGTSTAARDVGSGTADVPVEQAVTGLKPATTYHFRLVANSGGAETVGADKTFTTDPAPKPSITAASASSATSTSVVLSATVNPNGAATTVVFDYGRTTAYGTTTSAENAGEGADPVTVRRTLTGLEPRKSYHFRVRATNTSGETVSGDRRFVTVRAASPSAATSGIAEVQPTAAVVVGRVNPRNRSGSAFAEYGTSRTRLGSRTPGTAVAGGEQGVRLAIGGLRPGTRYYARVAVQTDGGTARGSTTAFTTPSLGGLVVTPSPVPYGRTATIQGRILGSGASGVRVVLEGTPHPFTDPLVGLGIEARTDRSGAFAMRRVFRRRLRVRIRADINGTAVLGPQVGVKVRPIVRTRIRRISGGRVRITGTITPRGSYAVSLRRGSTALRRSRSRTTGGASRYRFTFRVRRTGDYAVRAVRLDRSLVSHTSRARRISARSRRG